MSYGGAIKDFALWLIAVKHSGNNSLLLFAASFSGVIYIFDKGSCLNRFSGGFGTGMSISAHAMEGKPLYFLKLFHLSVMVGQIIDYSLQTEPDFMD